MNYQLPPQQPPPFGQPAMGGGPQPPPYQGRWTSPFNPKLVRPSLHWLWLAPLAVMVGIALAVLLGVHAYNSLAHFAPRDIRPPQTVILNLHRGDARAVFAQASGPVGSGREVAGPQLSCTVRDAASQQPVALRAPDGVTTVTIDGSSYVERLHFKAPRRGSYALTCDRPRGAALAVGRDPSVVTTVLEVFGLVACAFGGIVVAVVILVVVLVRRSHHRSRLEHEAWQASGFV